MVPVADGLLDLAAAVDPRCVRPGIPAHAALMYPWLPVSAVTPQVLTRLAQLVDGTGPTEVLLSSAATQAGGFVGIEAAELTPLASTLRAEWPDHGPYGGRFGSSPPVHVTVAMGAAPEDTARIAEQVGQRLPLVQPVRELCVVGLDGDGWRVLATTPLR
jgi:hypothetical protein